MLVQFGNNWVQKIPLTAKLDSACGLVQFWLSSNFFFIQLLPNWTACSPITYTNFHTSNYLFFFTLVFLNIHSTSMLLNGS